MVKGYRPTGVVQNTKIGCDTAAVDGRIPFEGAVVKSHRPAGVVDTAAAAGATSFVLNQAPLVAFAASATLVFTQYPELLVKLNFGQHEYYAATATA